jgi:tetratricopeptide (TPR) repeat protein
MKQLDLKANPDDFAAIAHKSDGTYRNILLNLRRWHTQSKEVNKDDFTDTLDGSWRDVYESAIRKHPAVKYIYEAIDLLQQVDIPLEGFLIESTALMIWGGNGFQKFVRSVRISLAFDYLTKETKNLRRTEKDFGEFSPNDGQIEAMGTKIDWSKYIFDLEKIILDLGKRPSRPNLLVAYCLFRLGLKCLITERSDEANKVWRKIPVDNLYTWSKASFSGLLGILPWWQDILRHASKQEHQSYLQDFLVGLFLETFDHNAKAEFIYRQIITRNPTDAYAQVQLGDIFRESKRYQEAEEAYCKAIENNPDYAHAYTRLGSLLRVLQRYSEAEDAYRSAIAKDPDDIFTYWRFGALLVILRRYVEAEAIYRQAITKGGNDIYISYINFDFGSMLRKLGRYAEAEAAYRKAIELRPQDAHAYKNLVYLLRFEVSNREEEALPFLEKWIEVDQQDFQSYLAVSSIRKQLGKTFPVDYVDKARQLIPEDDWYNRACLESICDNLDSAFDYLQYAKQNENFNPTWAWKDPDLEWVRNDPRFVKIIGPRPEEQNPEA